MKIAVLDDYQSVAQHSADWSALDPSCTVDFIHTFIPVDQRAKVLKPYDVLVIMRERTPFPAELLDALPHLKLLVTTGPRNRAIDFDAAQRKGVVVCGTRGDPFLAAELSWALLMALYKNVVPHHQATLAGRWQPSVPRTVAGSTLGLVGMGKLGQRMAQFGKLFNMNVMAWSPNLTQERCEPFGVTYASKETLFESADAISIHMVLSERTRGLVGESDLRRMKKTSFLVNTSRGPLVDEQALIQALAENRIAGAALDVFDQEPLPPDAPLLRVPNVLLSPHTGYVSQENYRTFYSDAIDDIVQWLAGAPVRVLQG
jgi:phosphoglycerate dehydrogenase-like enzyme